MDIITIRHQALVRELPQHLKNKLTFSYLNEYLNKEKTIIGYEKSIDGYWIPRAIVPDFTNKIEDGQWSQVRINFNGQIRDYQRQIVEKYLNGNRQGIISAGTGSGKTVMGLYIAHKIGLKTLIVVPTDRIFYQWIQRCENFCGFTPSIIRGDICKYDKPITVAMLQTLALGKRIRKDKIYKEFGLTIYDEIHKLGAEKFHVVAKMFWDKHRLGLSATPTRKDNMHHLFIAHIGEVCVQYFYSDIKPVVYIVQYIDKNTSAHPFIREKKFNLARYLNHISKLEDRNYLIVYYILQGLKMNRRILMLTDRISMIEKIRDILIHVGINQENIGLITGEMKDTDRSILLGTYGSAGIGLDIPELDYLILATPRVDIRQSVGRIMRPKQRTPIVIDIVDSISEIFRIYSFHRRRFYQMINAKIYDHRVEKDMVISSFKRMGFFGRRK